MQVQNRSSRLNMPQTPMQRGVSGMPASADGTEPGPVDVRSGSTGSYFALLPLLLAAPFALDTAFTVAWVAAAKLDSATSTACWAALVKVS